MNMEIVIRQKGNACQNLFETNMLLINGFLKPFLCNLNGFGAYHFNRSFLYGIF